MFGGFIRSFPDREDAFQKGCSNDPELRMRVLQDTFQNLISGKTTVTVDLIAEGVYGRSKVCEIFFCCLNPH